MYSRTDKAKIRKTFREQWEAKAWRHDQLRLAENGLLRATTRRTLNEIAAKWVAGARSGSIRNRSGRLYKPSSLRTIEQDLRLHLLPSLGARRIATITRTDLQHLLDRKRSEGLGPSRIRAILNAARVLWRDIDLLTQGADQISMDPTHGLRLPAVDQCRRRIASSAEARRLINALPSCDQALWAAALYAGLRHGELRALQARDVDLERRRVHVTRAWDQYEGQITPKTVHGTRTAIITQPLQRIITRHLQETRRQGSDLLFGSTPTTPFTSSTVNQRARRAWASAPGGPLLPIRLHDCRHSAISQMLDAGIPIDKVSKFAGHASIAITVDRYGHLLPTGETHALAQLDHYHAKHMS